MWEQDWTQFLVHSRAVWQRAVEGSSLNVTATFDYSVEFTAPVISEGLTSKKMPQNLFSLHELQLYKDTPVGEHDVIHVGTSIKDRVEISLGEINRKADEGRGPKLCPCFEIWLRSSRSPAASTITACWQAAQWPNHSATGINIIGQFRGKPQDTARTAGKPSRAPDFPGRLQGDWTWDEKAATTLSDAKKKRCWSGTTWRFVDRVKGATVNSDLTRLRNWFCNSLEDRPSDVWQDSDSNDLLRWDEECRPDAESLPTLISEQRG